MIGNAGHLTQSSARASEAGLPQVSQDPDAQSQLKCWGRPIPGTALFTCPRPGGQECCDAEQHGLRAACPAQAQHSSLMFLPGFAQVCPTTFTGRAHIHTHNCVNSAHYTTELCQQRTFTHRFVLTAHIQTQNCVSSAHSYTELCQRRTFIHRIVSVAHTHTQAHVRAQYCVNSAHVISLYLHTYTWYHVLVPFMPVIAAQNGFLTFQKPSLTLAGC